jgi:hypothetical protein
MDRSLVDAAQDYWLWQAQREIYASEGVRTSIEAKAKALTKFGRTLNADAGVKTTVASFQGTEVNETFVTTNAIDSVVSDNADDTEELQIEGHTIDGSGNLTFAVQQATLTGQTPVTLGTPLARCTRLYVRPGTFASPASDLVGNVYAYDSVAAGGVTAGVPNTASATKCMVDTGSNQSAKCATSLSAVDYWLVTSVQAGVERGSGSTARADIDVEFRQRGGVWRPLGLEVDLNASAGPFVHLPLKPYRVIPPNSDVRLVATADSANTIVGGSINGVLAIVL